MKDKIITDKNEIMDVIEKYRDAINVNPLEFASEELRNDRDVVLKAATSNFYGLYYAADEFKNDREIALAAINYNGMALSCLSEELRNDKEIVLKAINNNNSKVFIAFKFASEELRNDKEVVKAAVKKYGGALQFASDKLKNDREIVFEAVKNYGDAFEYASEELRNDKEIIMEAFKHNIPNHISFYILDYAGDDLKNDREVILEAIKQRGDALRYAGEELRNDKEIVLAAVKKDGEALRFASDELKNDREIVFEAVKNYGDALFYASKELKNDKEIVLQAVRLCEEAFASASKNLQNDSDVKKIFDDWQKSKKISNLEIHDDEINKIIIVTKTVKQMDKVSQVILKKYPNNTYQIDNGKYKNILYFEQSLDSMYDIIDIGSIFKKLEKIVKNRGIIISKLESNQTGMMQLEYYFGENVKNKIYDNYNEFYNGRSLSYFEHDKKSWLKCLSEEINFIVNIEENNLSEEEINILKSLKLL